MNLETDIAILGAGPAGAAAAWRLHQLGRRCVLVDRARFPRDKICGDALSGKAVTLLRRLDAGAVARLRGLGVAEPAWGIRFVAPSGRPIEVPFADPLPEDRDDAVGYVARRVDFDNFLVDELRALDNVELHLGRGVAHVESLPGGGWELRTGDGEWVCRTRVLLVADGATSRFARREAKLSKRPAHHAAGVRAYMRGVTGFHPDGYIELHFLREYLPGYVWVFPLPDGSCNVGIGMRSDALARRGLNLRAEIREIVDAHPLLRARFNTARFVDEPVGFPLPLGSRLRRLSGEGYMVLGDAGHLIDPLTGEGIGNGMYSGIIAAEQADRSLSAGDTSAAGLSDYDVRIARVLGRELDISYAIQRSLRWPRVINGLAALIGSRPEVISSITRMYTDLELRSQVTNPLFWARSLLRGALP